MPVLNMPLPPPCSLSPSLLPSSLSELHDEMEELEGKIQAVFRQTASELSLEPHKTIKLESSAQLGHFLRVTKKVGWGGRG